MANVEARRNEYTFLGSGYMYNIRTLEHMISLLSSQIFYSGIYFYGSGGSPTRVLISQSISLYFIEIWLLGARAVALARRPKALQWAKFLGECWAWQQASGSI